MEISNRTISILLIATIAVYLGGTFVSLNRLSSLGYSPISGLVTANTSLGNVSLQISSATSIVWTVSAIDWGSGYVSGSCNNCTMVVNGTDSVGDAGSYDATCCNTWTWVNDSLLLKNTGNQNVDLSMNATQNHTDWWTTNTPAGLDFKFEPESDRSHTQADQDDSGDSCADGQWNGYEDTWTSLATFTAKDVVDVCGDSASGTDRNFTFAPTANEVNMDFRVIVPGSYGPSGTETFQTLVFMLATS